jgi:hypothetical protein
VRSSGSPLAAGAGKAVVVAPGLTQARTS